MALIRNIRRIDWVLILSAFVLFAFGVSAIYSVELSRGVASFPLIQKQVIALLLGLGVAVFVMRLGYPALRNYGRGLYALGVLLLFLVLVFGSELNGAKGWFVVGNLFAFQPIEFMKIGLIAELARFFGEHADRRFGWRDFAKSGVLTAIPAGLLMLQPDLGGATLLVGMWLILCFFAGASWKHFGLLALVGAAIFSLGWFVVFDDYQRDRIRVFIDPASDPLYRGYNVTQAKIAIGAGGVFGRGLGSGSQSQLRFLPESEADFVFAVIAEELGFVGVAVIVAAIMVLLARLVSTARATRDTFAAYLALGVFGLLAVQSAVHIGANLSVLPATGVALPFVSYGGSSLVLCVTLLAIGQSVAVSVTPEGRRGVIR